MSTSARETPLVFLTSDLRLVTSDWDRLRRLVSSLPPAEFGDTLLPLYTSPPDWIASCHHCGRVIDTREICDGGDAHGAQDGDGRWTCSPRCWEAGLPDDAASEPDDAPTPASRIATQEQSALLAAYRRNAMLADGALCAAEAREATLRAALRVYASGESWRMGGVCDPCGSGFRGLSIASAALAAAGTDDDE